MLRCLHPSGVSVTLIVVIIVLISGVVVGSTDQSVGRLPVQDRGRIRPLEVHARYVFQQLVGQDSPPIDRSSVSAVANQVLSPGELLAFMVADPEVWRYQPLIAVNDQMLLEVLELSQASPYVSLAQLETSPVWRNVTEQWSQGRAPSASVPALVLQQVAVLFEKVALLQLVLSGQTLKIVPTEPENPLVPESAHWLTPWEYLAREDSLPEFEVLWQAWLSAAQSGDLRALTQIAQEFKEWLRAFCPTAYPDSQTLDRELRYYRLRPFRLAAFLCVPALIVWFLCVAWKTPWIFFLAWLLTLPPLLMQGYGFWLRWVLTGYMPVTNMYESLLCMAWGCVLCALVGEYWYRNGVLGTAACLAAALSLLAAENLPLDQDINPVAPILKSNFWLGVHVITIMASYALFAVVSVLAHGALVLYLVNPDYEKRFPPIYQAVMRLLQGGVFLLITGTILGGLWAQFAWGRFWGWDPKETWALITILGYLVLIHVRWRGWIKDFGLMVWSIPVSMLVVMCYYGVNFLLAYGKHSYGFSQGGVPWFVVYLVVEIVFVLLVWNRCRHHTDCQ